MSSKLLHLSMVAQSRPRHTASIIFMHGSGGTGPMAKEGIKMVLGKNMSFPHIRILYPTAPRRPYTPSYGQLQHVWFNRKDYTLRDGFIICCELAEREEDMNYIRERHDISLTAEEDLTTIEPMAEEINELINQEVQQGIAIKRIILGGFSMGANLAMQMGYRFRPDIGGVFVLSSFLNKNSKVYEVLDSSPHRCHPPLFMCHGEKDDIVPYAWGQHTFKELQQRGITGEFHSFPNMYHCTSKEELNMLHWWILQQLPED